MGLRRGSEVASMNQYEGIVEVQGLTPRRVNHSLENGYQLLAIETVTKQWAPPH